MSTSVSGLSNNFFPSPQSGFTTTLASSISASATSVPLNSVAGYSNGEVATLVIDPGNSSKQVFTGVVDTSGIQLTSVVWTAGTNVAHTAGATVTDYATATHIAMISKGIKIAHNQDGTHKSGAVYTLPTITDFTNATHDHSATSKGGQLSSTAFATGGLNTTALNNPYKFSAYLTGNQTITGNTWTKMGINTKTFDTGTNFNTSTNQFTAPAAGVYQFNATLNATNIADTGTVAIGLNVNTFSSTPTYVGQTLYSGANTVNNAITMSKMISLAANDTVQLYGYSGSTGILAGVANTYFEGFLVSAT